MIIRMNLAASSELRFSVFLFARSHINLSQEAIANMEICSLIWLTTQMMWCSVIRLKNSYSNLFPWKCISIAHKQKLQLSIILLILTWLQITFRYMDMKMILAFYDPCCIIVSRDKCFVHSVTHKLLYHWTLLTKWKFLPPLSIDEVCGNWVFYLSLSTVFYLSSSSFSSSCFLLSSIATLSFLTSHAVIVKRSQYIDQKIALCV